MSANKPNLIFSAGFQAIEFNSFRESTLKEGETLVEHVFNVKEERSERGNAITAQCVPATRITSSPYSIHFELTPDRIVSSGRCSCVAGVDALCKHSAAVVLFINRERATGSTDDEQKWKGPSLKARSLYPKGASIQSLLGGASSSERQSTKESDLDKTVMLSEFERFGLSETSIGKSLIASVGHDCQMPSSSLEMEVVIDIDQDIEAMFLDERVEPMDLLVLPGTSFFFDDKIACSPSDALKIFKTTMGQSENPTWFVERKYRISASTAHRIANARKEETAKKYFFGNAFDCKNFRYGRTMEQKAKDVFSATHQHYELLNCGLVVHPQIGWLCATPDALLRSDEGLLILEVKCPSSCEGDRINVPYLSNGNLSRNHPYFAQVQIQMFVCNVKKAVFFVFSEADNVTVEISRDDVYL